MRFDSSGVIPGLTTRCLRLILLDAFLVRGKKLATIAAKDGRGVVIKAEVEAVVGCVEQREDTVEEPERGPLFGRELGVPAEHRPFLRTSCLMLYKLK